MKYKADLVISIDYSDYESGAVVSIAHDDGSTNIIFATVDSKEIEDLEYICEQGRIRKLQAQAFDIINKKSVDTMYLRTCFEDNQPVARYNEYILNSTFSHYDSSELTQEEFATLKEAFKHIPN